MPTRDLDLEKRLLYKLCEFLIQKKKEPEGKGLTRPIIIKISELAPLLDYTQGSGRQKWENIAAELEGLKAEESLKHPGSALIKQINSTALLSGGANGSGKISLRYDRLDLEEFLKELKNRNRQLKEPETADRLILRIEDGQSVLSFNDRVYPIKNSSGKIRASIVNLLFGLETMVESGENVSINKFINELSSAEDIDAEMDAYEPGKKVPMSLLAKIIFDESWEEGANRSKLKRKIRDACSGLNGIVHKHFGINFLQIEGGKEVRFIG